MKFICSHCGKQTDKPTGEVNRARKAGLPLHCNRVCAGLGRRDARTLEQKKADKRLYDMEYRRKNREMLKAKKAATWRNWYKPEEQSKKRRTPEYRAKHRAYLSKPEYKEYKKKYDLIYRNKQDYGDYWEAAILALEIDREVESRMDDVEVRRQNGTLNKSLQRKRDYERLISNQS